MNNFSNQIMSNVKSNDIVNYCQFENEWIKLTVYEKKV
jgi:hypothetical protein